MLFKSYLRLLLLSCSIVVTSYDAFCQKNSVSFVYSDLGYVNLGVQGAVRPFKHFMLSAYAHWRPKVQRTEGFFSFSTILENGYVLEINPAFRLPFKLEQREWAELYIGPYAQIKKFKGKEVFDLCIGPCRTLSSDRHFTVLGISGGFNVKIDDQIALGVQGGFGELRKDLLNGDAMEEEIRSAGGKAPPAYLLLARASLVYYF